MRILLALASLLPSLLPRVQATALLQAGRLVGDRLFIKPAFVNTSQLSDVVSCVSCVCCFSPRLMRLLLMRSMRMTRVVTAWMSTTGVRGAQVDQWTMTLSGSTSA